MIALHDSSRLGTIRMKTLRTLSLVVATLAASWFSSEPAFAADPTRLVLKGYDPVAYFTDGKPVKGRAAYSYDWDEGRYYFESKAHREMFVADPDRYAPQFSGYCTQSMAQGIRKEGNPDAWVVMDGRLFVSGAQEEAKVDRFRRMAVDDPPAFRETVAKARKHWETLRRQPIVQGVSSPASRKP